MAGKRPGIELISVTYSACSAFNFLQMDCEGVWNPLESPHEKRVLVVSFSHSVHHAGRVRFS